MQKQTVFKIKGMQRDLTASIFNPEYAYENKNVRISPTDDNTLLSLVNEKGNKLATINGEKSYIKGIPIGQASFEDKVVLFTCKQDEGIIPNIESSDLDINSITSEEISLDIESQVEDRIYELWFNNDKLEGKLLYRGDLSFNYNYPIETLPYYENEFIQKVYWNDSLNQLRVINTTASDEKRQKWSQKSFDFVRKLALSEIISIEKSSGSGVFPAGVIQYAFTYISTYGQESNIFHTSPLYYISHTNRGGSPEDKLGNQFSITIENPDPLFDYVRIYSIIRTSIDATPEVKRVADIEIYSGANKLTYIDNGLSGDSVDPTQLLYIGGEEISVESMTHKDNTLFLGGIKIKRQNIPSDIRNYFKGGEVKFFCNENSRQLETPRASGYYPYNNQLKYNSRQIKTFKYLEYYRMGVQFQHYTGKWSEPIWINDVQNNQHINTNFYTEDNIQLPAAQYILNNPDCINKLLSSGYVKVRPVIVYPNINDREVKCQGILCPTVYNVGDRFSNTPFAQSSWFVRPNIPFDIDKAFQTEGSTIIGDYGDLATGVGPTMYSRAGIISNEKQTVDGVVMDTVNKGAWVEFRHGAPIPGNDKRNAEIQCIHEPPENPYLNAYSSLDTRRDWVDNNSVNFYVDQNILTLHSPDIEFDDDLKNYDMSSLKMRIVGMVPLTSFASDIDIQTSTPVNSFYLNDKKDEITEIRSPRGFYKESIGASNDFKVTRLPVSYGGDIIRGDSYFGYRSLVSGAFWFDEITGYKDDVVNRAGLTTGFVVYPWHRNGSLNNTQTAVDGYKSAMLDKKKMSNLKFSFQTQYMDPSNIWSAYKEKDNNATGISGVAIFDSNEVSLVKIPAPLNSTLNEITYYGNIDKVLAPSKITTEKAEDSDGTEYLAYKGGYPIMIAGANYDISFGEFSISHQIFSSNYSKVPEDVTNQTTSIDPVRIKYKSTPHAVLALNYTSEGHERILPTIYDTNDSYTGDPKWPINENYGGKILKDSNMSPFWCSPSTGSFKSSQDIINTGIKGNVEEIGGLQYGWLWLGELYDDTITEETRFGGRTEEAFEQNQWVPCGEAVSLLNNGKVQSSITIVWEEGDTYYQRYDHIKTYPFTLEDQNAMTEVVSFMCETKVNLDGRYDRNRGQTTNFTVTPENFNQVNDVYSQKDNFFVYRGLNVNKDQLYNFPNTITWTKTKTIGELVDSWTNLILSSTLDLDGNKGNLTALKKFNNDIIAFQSNGISQILYNEQMQITSTEGVPIEIANSGKVQGKRYLYNDVGCGNKWSICETTNGIYFIDDVQKSIFLFSGKLDNISDRLGMHSWMHNKEQLYGKWNPVDFNNFISYYDKINNEVLFISKDNCLAFSEALGQFTTFYSYESTPYLCNIHDKSIAWHAGVENFSYYPWLQQEGDYNMFFDIYQPFYTTIIANPDMYKDKVFNNLEFLSDSWDKDNNLLSTTFDTLEVWNEYQRGKSILKNVLGKPSNIKRKFRTWRANIPRDKSNNRDRMRNQWLYIKLSKDVENTDKTILHNMVVSYTE